MRAEGGSAGKQGQMTGQALIPPFCSSRIFFICAVCLPLVFPAAAHPLQLLCVFFCCSTILLQPSFFPFEHLFACVSAATWLGSPFVLPTRGSTILSQHTPNPPTSFLPSHLSRLVCFKVSALVMASLASDDASKAGNSVPAKLNGLGGSEPEIAASRASTPKSTRSELAPKNPFMNGVSKPNSRASTPKSTQSAARNGVSRAGSRQSTPKTQPASKGLPTADLSFSTAVSCSNIQSAAENPPLMTRSASKSSRASKDQAAPDAHSGEPHVTAQAASDAPSAEIPAPNAQVASNAHSSEESTSKTQSTAKDNTSDVHHKDTSTPQPEPASTAQLPKDTSSKPRRRGNPNWIARSDKGTSSKPRTTSKRNRIPGAGDSSSKARSSKRNTTAATHSKDTPSNPSQSASLINSTPEENISESTGAPHKSSFEHTFSLVPEAETPGHSVNGVPSSGTASRSRRETRKPRQLKTPNHALDTPAQSTPSHVNSVNNDIETPDLSAPETGDKRRKQTTRGPRKNRKRNTANAPTSTPKDTPINSPALTETQPPHSQDVAMPDATPILNSEPGPEGNTEGPASPTSNSPGGNRVSGRVRKPTDRAMESVGSGRRGRRGRGRGGNKGGRPRKHPIPKPAVSANGRRLFDLAMTAIDPNFKPLEDADDIIEKLRRDYETPKEKENQTPAAPETENDGRKPTQAYPFHPLTNDLVCIDIAKEEYMIVTPDLQLYRPPNTYGDTKLPPPPLRLRTWEQAERDRIFGYPPRIGERNVPRSPDRPFEVEDVNAEIARIQAKQAAHQNGISTPASQTGTPAQEQPENTNNDDLVESTGEAAAPTPSSQVGTPTQQAGNTTNGLVKLPIGKKSTNEAAAPTLEGSRKRRRRGADETVEKEEKKREPKKRRQTVAVAPAVPKSSRKRGRRVDDEQPENEETTVPKRRRRTAGAVDETDKPKKRRQIAASVDDPNEPNENGQTEETVDEMNGPEESRQSVDETNEPKENGQIEESVEPNERNENGQTEASVETNEPNENGQAEASSGGNDSTSKLQRIHLVVSTPPQPPPSPPPQPRKRGRKPKAKEMKVAAR